MTIIEGTEKNRLCVLPCPAPTMWLGTKGMGVHPVLANRYESYSYQALAPDILCLTPLQVALAPTVVP